MKRFRINDFAEFVTYSGAFILSVLFISWEITNNRYFLFKENSIQYLKDNSFSIELSDKWVPLSSLPADAENILIRVEDKRFFSHKGYSPYDLHSVLFHSLFLEKKLRGASTITQQLARTLFLNREKTIQRKLKEIHIAVALERSMHKREILEYYMNTVYWGKGFHGIYYASRFHFGKPPEQLKPEEFSHLVNILKAPDHSLR